MVRWWRRCCCWMKEKASPTMDDSSALIQPAAAFIVPPRRHSSANIESCIRSTPATFRTHSDSGSSSDEDEFPRRGRCWSDVVPSDVSAVLHSNNGVPALKKEESRLPEIPESAETVDVCPQATPPPEEIAGTIHFTASYSEHDHKLFVFVDRVVGLPRIESGPVDDPVVTFVRLSLTHSRKHLRLTRTGRGRNPVFKEEHVIQTTRSAPRCALRLSVMQNEREGRHDALGHALLILNTIGATKEQYSLPLLPSTVTDHWPLGQVQIGLTYSHRQSRLIVHVIKARRINSDKHTYLGKVDTFAKVTLLCSGSKVVTGRSSLFPFRPDPPFDHRSHFVLPPAYLHDASVRVSVVARGTLGRALTLGRVSLGPHTHTGTGLATHWGRMLQEERTVVQWRNLCL